MIKIVSILYRNPALTHEEFRDYWLNIHVPLIRKAVPELALYKGNLPANYGGPDRPGGNFECDGIVEIGFHDMETLERVMGSEAWLSPERDLSSRHLLDLERTTSVVVEEFEFLDG